MPKNVENFEIRTLGRDDYAQAAEIFAFVHALHQANRPDIYRKTNVPLGEDEFFKMCDDPHEIMLCAVRDGKILGLARTVMRGNAGDAVTLSRVRAVMEELAVLPQAQGMGIGTALLYASEAEAKRRGAESLELMVWSFNKSAMRFYESAGMTVRSFVMEKKLEARKCYVNQAVEALAAETSDTVCLGVGLHSGYGAAQRMYVLRGYVPDGSGVWYEGRVWDQYAPCVSDDELNLFLSKKLF